MPPHQPNEKLALLQLGVDDRLRPPEPRNGVFPTHQLDMVTKRIGKLPVNFVYDGLRCSSFVPKVAW